MLDACRPVLPAKPAAFNQQAGAQSRFIFTGRGGGANPTGCAVVLLCLGAPATCLCTQPWVVSPDGPGLVNLG